MQVERSVLLRHTICQMRSPHHAMPGQQPTIRYVTHYWSSLPHHLPLRFLIVVRFGGRCASTTVRNSEPPSWLLSTASSAGALPTAGLSTTATTTVSARTPCATCRAWETRCVRTRKPNFEPSEC